ncbi:MAG: succinylglutamate desuccinylase/aspartoacylase family protein [Lachnospiraceae bacterium]|nr:succinylglutamate desuccinylase/aspartoacylase family protein [Lachnospiraceae bacterium]
MKKALTIAGITVQPGEKVKHTYTIPDANGMTLPVVIINGAEDGKVFLASAGIHGAEYPGIQACIELAEELDPNRIRGAVILIPVVNLSGFYGRKPYICPADEEQKNLNRVFPGSPDGTNAEKLAYFMTEEIIRQCDFHVDLHSGDMVESLEEFCAVANTQDPELRAYITEAAKHTSFSHRIQSGGQREVYNRTANGLGIPAMLFERGGGGRVVPEEITRNKTDLVSLMQFLEILPGTPIDSSDRQIYYPVHRWIEAVESGCCYSYVKVGDEIRKGQLLCEIRDPFGNLLQSVTAECDGRVKILNNCLGIAAGDDLIMYGSTREEQ